LAIAPPNKTSLGNITTIYHIVNRQTHFFQNFYKILLWDCIDLGYEDAWKEVLDPNGFKATFGLTTAERRHPKFRLHGVGGCEWDGAVWPFAPILPTPSSYVACRFYALTIASRTLHSCHKYK
jgi:hypothetical protein